MMDSLSNTSLLYLEKNRKVTNGNITGVWGGSNRQPLLRPALQTATDPIQPPNNHLSVFVFLPRARMWLSIAWVFDVL